MKKELCAKIAEILRQKINQGMYISYTGLSDSELTEEFFKRDEVKEYVCAVSEGSGKAKRISMVKSYGAEPLLFDEENEIAEIHEKAFCRCIDSIKYRDERKE